MMLIVILVIYFGGDHYDQKSITSCVASHWQTRRPKRSKPGGSGGGRGGKRAHLCFLSRFVRWDENRGLGSVGRRMPSFAEVSCGGLFTGLVYKVVGDLR